jgi:hypothetical protein
MRVMRLAGLATIVGVVALLFILRRKGRARLDMEGEA